MKNYLKYFCLIIFVGLNACSDDDFPVPEASTLDVKFEVQSEERTITFTNQTRVAENAGDVKYNWDFGDGTFSNEESPVKIYTTVGIYTVRLVATADNDVDYFESSVAVIGGLDVNIFYANGAQGTLNQLPGNSVALETGGQIFGVDYDPVNEKVYYTSNSQGTLSRSDLNGTTKEVLITGLVAPRDVAVDTDNNRVYVVARGSNEIIMYDIESGTSSVLYSTDNGLGELPVAIDYHDGHIYATCVGIDFESVYKGAVDGSGIINIIGYGAGGYGYGIAIDKQNEKIYFDNFDGNQIMQANLDGTGVVAVANTLGRVYGITVDNTNGLIYWSDDGDNFIKKANLDGSEVVPVSLTLQDPLGIFFIP